MFHREKSRVESICICTCICICIRIGIAIAMGIHITRVIIDKLLKVVLRTLHTKTKTSKATRVSCLILSLVIAHSFDQCLLQSSRRPTHLTTLLLGR